VAIDDMISKSQSFKEMPTGVNQRSHHFEANSVAEINYFN
jgi:hypothetical protein